MNNMEEVVFFLFWSIPFFGLLGTLYLVAYVYLYHSKQRRKKLKKLKRFFGGNEAELARLKEIKKSQKLDTEKDFN